MKRVFVFIIFLFALNTSIVFAFEPSMGLSVSTLFSDVYLFKQTYYSDYEIVHNVEFEDFNYIRVSTSIDIKYLWVETGLSTTGPMAEGILYSLDDTLREYSLFLSAFVKFPFKNRIFTIFPMAGVEWTYVLAMNSNGENIKNQLPKEYLQYLNNRLVFKIGLGLDIDISKKMYIRLWGTKGIYRTDPDDDYSNSIQSILPAELNGYYLDEFAKAYVFGLMLGYRLDKNK